MVGLLHPAAHETSPRPLRCTHRKLWCIKKAEHANGALLMQLRGKQVVLAFNHPVTHVVMLRG
jgi:hypothetical protein